MGLGSELQARLDPTEEAVPILTVALDAGLWRESGEAAPRGGKALSPQFMGQRVQRPGLALPGRVRG
jgi:hypothetical protein